MDAVAGVFVFWGLLYVGGSIKEAARIVAEALRKSP